MKCVRIQLCAVSLALATFVAHAGDPPSTRVALRIEQQPVRLALKEFSEQSGVQVLLRVDNISVDGVLAPKVDGQLTVQAALDRLLQNTGLKYEFVNDRTVRISAAVQPSQNADNAKEGTKSDPPFRMAQVDQATAPQPFSVEKDTSNSFGQNEKNQYIQLEQVVVTGSHIRGEEKPVGSQLITIDADAIKKGGFSTVAEAMFSLPENFKGRIQEEQGSTASNATALNLRGLGANSTLTLVDGHRLAPSSGDGLGEYTDISSIPLSAVERIEVLPDGASALYGSDAVGGVVNVIMKKVYDGFDTTARVGSITGSSSKEYLLGQSMGKSWDSGGMILSGEYYDRGVLPQYDRREWNSDLRGYGGSNFDTSDCNPGTISVGGKTYAIPAGQNGVGLTPASFVAGTKNFCNANNFKEILPSQRRWSVFGSVHQDISSTVELFANASYSDRTDHGTSFDFMTLSVPNTNAFYVNPSGGTGTVSVLYDLTKDLGPANADINVKTHSFVLGTKISLGRNWQVQAYGAQSQEKLTQQLISYPDLTLLNAALTDPNPTTAFDPFGDGSFTNPATLANLISSRIFHYFVDSKLTTGDVVADGPLFSLPGGEVKLAVGAEYQHLNYEATQYTWLRSASTAPVVTQPFNYDRRVGAEFGELLVPIVGAENAHRGMEQVNLSVSGRHEHYSDFGGTTVPRTGLDWTVVPGFTLRGAWSKSFRVPNPKEALTATNYSYAYTLNDPNATNGTGKSVSLVEFGGNSALKPETANIWSVGMNWRPVGLRGVVLDLNYFDIDYTNRITTLTSSLANPANYAGITRSPTAAQIAAACNVPTFENISAPVPPSGATSCQSLAYDIIYDLRYVNASSLKERGIDLLGAYPVYTRAGVFSFGLNATYLLAYDQQTTATAPALDLVSTGGYPIDFKARGSMGWALHGFDTTLFINYADNYKDIISVPNRRIDSWTTFDLNMAYSFPERNGWLHGAEVAFNATNLFNKQPPFYNFSSPGTGYAYDVANASVIGRELSLTLRKSW